MEVFLAVVNHPDHCTGRFGVTLRCIYPSSRWQTQIDHFTCGTTKQFHSQNPIIRYKRSGRMVQSKVIVMTSLQQSIQRTSTIKTPSTFIPSLLCRFNSSPLLPNPSLACSLVSLSHQSPGKEGILTTWSLVSSTRISFSKITALPIRVELIDIVVDLLPGLSPDLVAVSAIQASAACERVTAIVVAAVCRSFFDRCRPGLDTNGHEEDGYGG